VERTGQHIALGSERIATQADLVATWRRKGCDIAYVQQIMAALRNCQSTLETTAWRFCRLMENEELDSGIIERSKASRSRRVRKSPARGPFTMWLAAWNNLRAGELRLEIATLASRVPPWGDVRMAPSNHFIHRIDKLAGHLQSAEEQLALGRERIAKQIGIVRKRELSGLSTVHAHELLSIMLNVQSSFETAVRRFRSLIETQGGDAKLMQESKVAAGESRDLLVLPRPDLSAASALDRSR
jgi:hypothetical protein